MFIIEPSFDIPEESGCICKEFTALCSLSNTFDVVVIVVVCILIGMRRLETAKDLLTVFIRFPTLHHVLAVALHYGSKFLLAYLSIAACIKFHPDKKTPYIVLYTY